MNESKKKLSLLAKLDDIISNNYVNNKVSTYQFHSIETLIINDTPYDVSNQIVKVILYLDEIIIEIYNDDSTSNTYNLPYNFIQDLYIILGD